MVRKTVDEIDKEEEAQKLAAKIDSQKASIYNVLAKTDKNDEQKHSPYKFYQEQFSSIANASDNKAKKDAKEKLKASIEEENKNVQQIIKDFDKNIFFKLASKIKKKR